MLKEAGFALSIIVCDSSLKSYEINEPLSKLCLFTFIVPFEDVEKKVGFFPRILDRLFGNPIPIRPVLKRILNEKLSEWAPDFIQAEKTFAGVHLDIEELQSQKIRIVLEEGGVHHIAYQRVASIKLQPSRWRWTRRAKKLRRYESELINRVDAVTAVSDIEANLLHKMNADAHIIKVPNGVDEKIMQKEPKKMSSREKALFFCGKLSYEPNADAVRFFLDDILPALKNEKINVKMVVAGGEVPSDLNRRAQNCSQLELLGYVPDIAEYFRHYAIMINPMRLGGGTNLKLLEAMAHGMACISTSLGAEGLDVENEKHILVADEPSEIASAIRLVLENEKLASSLGRSARELVQEKYTWRKCIKPLLKFYGS